MDQLRNFRDFLKLYNQISDSCFIKCTTTFGSRNVEPDEAKCIDICAQKFINVNHRIMDVYVEVQSAIVQNRVNEMNAAQVAAEVKNQEQEQSKVEVFN